MGGRVLDQARSFDTPSPLLRRQYTNIGVCGIHSSGRRCSRCRRHDCPHARQTCSGTDVVDWCDRGLVIPYAF
jgi:hypothetical protein